MSETLYVRYLCQFGGTELKIEQEGEAAFGLWFDGEKQGAYTSAKKARWRFQELKEPDAEKRDPELRDLPVLGEWTIEHFEGINGGATT